MRKWIVIQFGLVVALSAAIGLSSVYGQHLSVGLRPVELRIAATGDNMIHISVLEIGEDGFIYEVPKSSVIIAKDESETIVKLRHVPLNKLRVGQFIIQVQENPLRLHIEKESGRLIQKLAFYSGKTTFLLDERPVLGLGGGAKQFDRRQAYYPMKTGWGEWGIERFGSCLPITYLIGTSGWAMFINYPVGQIGLQGQLGRFKPNADDALKSTDLYIIDAELPPVAMAEYARLTGKPVLPPKWTM